MIKCMVEGTAMMNSCGWQQDLEFGGKLIQVPIFLVEASDNDTTEEQGFLLNSLEDECSVMTFVGFWSILKDRSDIRQYAIPVLQMLLLFTSGLVGRGPVHWHHKGLFNIEATTLLAAMEEVVDHTQDCVGKTGSVGRSWKRNVSRVMCLFCS